MSTATDTRPATDREPEATLELAQLPLDDLAQRVQAAAEQLETAKDGLYAAVADMRYGGASWADVGRALGVSRQAAWERFSGTAR